MAAMSAGGKSRTSAAPCAAESRRMPASNAQATIRTPTATKTNNQRERVMQSENTNDLSAALAKAQGDMTAAYFNRINPHFKNRYADLAAILDAIRAPLAKNNLALTQTTEIR